MPAWLGDIDALAAKYPHASLRKFAQLRAR
jgi:hypothetical protein